MNAKGQKHVCVDDIIEIMEAVAPPQLAQEWDNCGLQVGNVHWPVKKIWTALDPQPKVVQAAGQNNVDLVICHHPMIFKPLSRIDLATTIGAAIDTALRHKISIYAAHTNLDSAVGGINDVLARKIGLTHLIELMPPDQLGGDGVDGHDVLPMGLGRVGKLDPPVRVEKLARKIKTDLMLEKVKVAGNQQNMAHRAAVCSGSGGSLLNAFLHSDADVYISGDLKYHDARMVEDAGRCLIDIGHFASEHLIVKPLVEQLVSIAESRDWDIEIEACVLEKDPFKLL